MIFISHCLHLFSTWYSSVDHEFDLSLYFLPKLFILMSIKTATLGPLYNLDDFSEYVECNIIVHSFFIVSFHFMFIICHSLTRIVLKILIKTNFTSISS